MSLFWGFWVFVLANLLILVNRCNYLIDQWIGQLFPSLCFVWCHGHNVVTSMWRKFNQILGSFKGMVLWTKDVGVEWVKFCSLSFASIGNLMLNRVCSSYVWKAIPRLPWNHHSISIHCAFGQQFLHFGLWHILFLNILSW